MKYDRAARDEIFSNLVNREVALSGELSFINLTLSVYALNGSFLGFEDLSTQLHTCKGDDRTLQRFLKFGSNTFVNCALDLVHLIDRTDEPRFYELWIDDPVDRNGQVRAEGVALYPVPVIISNYEEKGRKPNKPLTDDKAVQLGVDSGQDVLDKVVLHRRFMLWDNISGKRIRDTTKPAASSVDAQKSEKPDVVRWAKYVELRITLQKNDKDTPIDESIRMYPPQLIIQYQQQMTSTVPRQTLVQGDIQEKMRYAEVEFRSTYTQELVRFWDVMMGLFIAWIILMVIHGGLKLSVRSQINALTWDCVLSDVLGAVSDWLFWGIFLVAGYWFFFFKLQSEVEALLPLSNPHPDFLIIVIVSGWCKIVHVALLIYAQCNVDIFFIDFEKEPLGSDIKEEIDALPNISVWRSILIGNEWCEMQTERHTDIDFTLMFLLFFLKGLNLVNLSTAQPVEQDLSEDVSNVLLRFFVICIFYFLVVIAQLIYKAIYYRFLGDPLTTFALLCQLSNISVFILDQALHGYYIHGRSVHPYTDVNLQQMQTNFKEEEEGKTPPRGLSNKTDEELNGESNLVFEMYITEKIREELAEQRSKMTFLGGKDNAESIANASRAHQRINHFLQTDFVALIEQDGTAEVMVPTTTHKMFGFPPAASSKDVPVLLRDNSNLFASVQLLGIERDLLLMDLLVFVMWDLVFKDVFIAALLTYIISHGVQRLKDQFGTSNVSAKTLIPDKFLV